MFGSAEPFERDRANCSNRPLRALDRPRRHDVYDAVARHGSTQGSEERGIAGNRAVDIKAQIHHHTSVGS